MKPNLFQKFFGWFIPAEDKVINTELRKARFFVITLLFIVILSVLNGLYFLTLPEPNLRAGSGAMIVGAVIIILLLFYRNLGKRKLFTNIFNVISFGMITALIYIDSGGIYSSDLMILVIMSAWTLLIAGKRSGITWFVLSTAVVITAYFLEIKHADTFLADFLKLPPEYNLINYLSGLLFMFFIVYTHEKNQETYIREINDQKKIIEEKNKDILDSMHYAKRIQRSQLPTDKYVERKLKELKKD
jgi:hypothetical protein